MLNLIKRDAHVRVFLCRKTHARPTGQPHHDRTASAVRACLLHREGGPGQAQGERLLQSLVDEEQKLLGKVEEARTEAARIVADAERRAAEVRQEALTRADRAAQERRDETERSSSAERGEILAQAERDIEGAEAGAQAAHDAAVKRVLERVLP